MGGATQLEVKVKPIRALYLCHVIRLKFHNQRKFWVELMPALQHPVQHTNITILRIAVYNRKGPNFIINQSITLKTEQMSNILIAD